MSTYSVALFAHNEEAKIGAAIIGIQAAIAAAPGHRCVGVYILCNGCTDRTVEVVRRLENGLVHGVDLAFGDKSETWNVFIHDLAPEADHHVIGDGDVAASPAAIALLLDAMEATPHAHAACAIPLSGRTRAAFVAGLIGRRELNANLHALRGTIVERLRAGDIRLPIRWIGDDALLCTLLRLDLDPFAPLDYARILPVPAATYRYDSLSLTGAADWRLYFNRRVRYAIRRMENWLLFPRFYREGWPALPRHADEIFRRHRTEMDAMPPGPGADRLFHRLALRRVRRRLAAGEVVPLEREEAA